MKGSWKTAGIFGLSLALVLTAMGSISSLALRLERAENDARRQALREEHVRLALWRMESTLAPLLGQESSRPYFTYSAFYPAGRSYTCMFNEVEQGEVLVPSPLLTRRPEHVLLHFQLGPDGEMTSPQVPPPATAASSPKGCDDLKPEAIEAAGTRLLELQALVMREALLRSLPREDLEKSVNVGLPLPPRRWEALPQGADRQAVLNWNDQQARFDACEPDMWQRQLAGTLSAELLDVREGLFRPLWAGDALVLARRVSVNGQDYVQGCWLDWPGIRKRLLEGVADLLPQADLLPVKPLIAAAPEGERERMLATLPLRLEPGEVPGEAPAAFSPIRLSLGVAWGCVLLAAGAVGALLWGAVSLSERRGAFVSAVTHELRTPLTTFRMYTEMLAQGMVASEEKRQSYLEKLQGEADRLSHLVENVLGYARLEGGRPAEVADVQLASLLERIRPRLEERAAQAGMAVEVEAAAAGARVRTDASAVEQILFNLVDNACKYAGGAANRRIRVEVLAEAAAVSVLVRDHGPGLSVDARRRLFQPFSKSDRDAASSAPGVGLGLALSRRLARAMGGDLRLAATNGGGACFELRLPVA